MKNNNRMTLTILLVCGTVFRYGPAAGQMVNPSIDKPGEPFSYFSRPTDEIGVMDGKWGTEITPEGYLYTGFGELMFFTGNPPEPAKQRVKTLLKGYLPVISYAFEKEGVDYTISAFAATLDGNPGSEQVNFVRVGIKNAADQPRTAFFGVGTRYQGDVNTGGSGAGDNTFYRPAASTGPGSYMQPGVEFNPDWVYGFSRDAFLRNGKVMYMFPARPAPERMLMLKTGYNTPPDLTPRKLHALPTSPVGIVLYELHLHPGEERVLDFKMPYTPVPADSSLVSEIRKAEYNEYLQRTVEFWENIFSRGIDINVPEAKVNDTFRANLVYDLIARNKSDGYYIQTVNDLHYHAFWLRDASFIVHMYLLSGYDTIAKQCLDFFSHWQQPDGNFVSQGGQFDGWGQTMWIYGQYFRFTHDTAFAEEIYPSVKKAVAWLERARAKDRLHLIPATTPGDNEAISGHITGHDFWALDGLRNVIFIAEGLGKTEDARKFEKIYGNFHADLIRRLDIVTARTGGYIPPGLDGQKPPGQDWGNILTLYPEILFPSFSRMVTATLDSTRAKYKEGIMTYGDGRFLHDYLTMRNTEDELVRGEQETALKEFYAVLLHTSSTNAGFEFAVRPWGNRDFNMNLTPHGWYAAEIRTLIRNMMVREEGNDLHLLSCISPDWAKDSDNISVRRAPTYFGQVNFELTFSRTGATILLNNRFTTRPAHIIIHMPWFMDVKSVVADGREMKIANSAVSLPPETRNVEISWTKKADVPRLSFNNAVANYEKEYREKYEEFLETGK